MLNARLAIPLTLLLAPIAGILDCSPAAAGPYAPAAGQPGSTAIFKDDPAFIAWATGALVLRGWQQIDTPSLGYASYGTPAMALGKAAGTAEDCVSLGDGGQATLTFANPVTNGSGPDFAVFENSFSDTFLELGFVEVSSDGTNFFRFPAVSLTPTDTQVDSFGTLDPTNINNLAGKYRAGYGTPFDLQGLAGVSPLLDVNAVTHVRIVDVVGCVQDAYASYDSQNHKVNDPWPTPFAYSGFDLDAVGVLQIPTHILPGQEFTAAGLTRDQLILDGILHISGSAHVGATAVSPGASGVLDHVFSSSMYTTNGLTLGSGAQLTVIGDGVLKITGPQSYDVGAILQIGSTGGSSPEFAGDHSAAAVPEPSALVLLLSAAGTFWWRQPRRRLYLGKRPVDGEEAAMPFPTTLPAAIPRLEVPSTRYLSVNQAGCVELNEAIPGC